MQGHKDTTHNPILPNEKGQMTIFLAVCIVIITSLLAFIVNVGMFVKAKINLQNAVDSAAQAGASVQARYMNNIAYMNWHMRNVYKEWMYKYYVLGHLGLNSTIADGGGVVDYRLPPLGVIARGTYNQRDPFNIPSICINFRGSFNICDTYTLPGLPRFESLGLPGIDETHNVFIRNLVEQKANDCVARTKINFTVARQWTYGLRGNTAPPAGTPRIALDRDGAFPAALEAAIRVRNLERIVNEPPKQNVSNGTANALCQSTSCIDVRTLSDASVAAQAPIHERTVKAFWSAFRTLSKAPDTENFSLKNTFVLTELTPNPKPSAAALGQTLSDYLIPSSGASGDFQPQQKHYLDLHLNLVNFAIFYTMFAPAEAVDPSQPIDQASCNSTKVAIPVPGYPLSFTKNPNLITYYAIRGEAYFTGLFSPFRDPVKMVAYAAAKPYGGKIGPRLFEVSTDEQTLSPRQLGFSFPYLTGIAIAGNYQDGYPLPFDANFWVDSSGTNVIGGTPQGSLGVKYSIPNMIYDFNSNSPDGFGGTADPIQTIGNNDADTDPPERAGLYSRGQFAGLKDTANLTGSGADINSFGADKIRDGIRKALAPTGYEAANFLIPTMQRHHDSQSPVLDSIAPIPNGFSESADTGSVNNPKGYAIYAPLFAPGLLYQGPSDLEESLNRYRDSNQLAITTYLDAIRETAIGVRQRGIAGGEEQYAIAAGGLFAPAGDLTVTDLSTLPASTSDTDCNSIVGNFNVFFFGGASGPNCPQPLVNSIRDRWQERLDASTNNGYRYFQSASYIVPRDTEVATGNGAPGNTLGIKKYMTGYLPGERHGASNEGDENYPLATQERPNHRRNYYSVKLVPLRSLIADPGIEETYDRDDLSLFVDTMNLNNDAQLTPGRPTTFLNDLVETNEVIPIKQ